MSKQLPSFFVIGAQKAGTTSLHDWLVKQPDVCLPKCKETHFFSQLEKFSLGVGWYLKQFLHSKNDAVKGEVDPEYMFFPEAPLRIRKLIESPRFICILRHPVERAYSHYLMSVRKGFEILQFPDALKAEDNRRASGEDEYYLPHHSYMKRAAYSEQIMRYRKTFPDSEFLYVKFDELFGENTCQSEYSRICKFLGLKSDPVYPDSGSKSNQASMPRSKFLRDLIFKQSTLKKFIGSFIPSRGMLKLKLAVMLDNLNQAPIQQDSGWRKIVPAEFWEAAREETKRLETLTGLDLKNWMERG